MWSVRLGVQPWSREEGMPETWYISRDGKQHGPITDIEFRKLVELGHLKETDFVWHDGAPDWMPGAQFLDHPPLGAKLRPPRPGVGGGEAPSTERVGLSGRRRVVVIAGSVVFAILAVAAAVFAIQSVMDGAFRSKVERTPSRGGFWRAPDGMESGWQLHGAAQQGGLLTAGGEAPLFRGTSWPDGRCRANRLCGRKRPVEESPGSRDRRWRLTAAGGDPRESATENRPPAQGDLRRQG